jgi:hypothetical protein
MTRPNFSMYCSVMARSMPFTSVKQGQREEEDDLIPHTGHVSAACTSNNF